MAIESIVQVLEAGKDVSAMHLWHFFVSEFLAIILSFALSFAHVATLRKVYNRKRLLREFIESIVLIAATVSFISMMVDSNLARAFALVGFLHVVSFRNRDKGSPGDITYLIVAVGIGIACGHEYWLIATLFTLIIIAVTLTINLTAQATTNIKE
jgi:hypothetical protein